MCCPGMASDSPTPPRPSRHCRTASHPRGRPRVGGLECRSAVARSAERAWYSVDQARPDAQPAAGPRRPGRGSGAGLSSPMCADPPGSGADDQDRPGPTRSPKRSARSRLHRWRRHQSRRHIARRCRGTAVVVKVVHSGARARVLDDLELMRALAGYVESHDETWPRTPQASW